MLEEVNWLYGVRGICLFISRGYGDETYSVKWLAESKCFDAFIEIFDNQRVFYGDNCALMDA